MRPRRRATGAGIASLLLDRTLALSVMSWRSRVLCRWRYPRRRVARVGAWWGYEAEGGMFWLSRNRLAGSYWSLTATSRL
jgi:hypothetical protein